MDTNGYKRPFQHLPLEFLDGFLVVKGKLKDMTTLNLRYFKPQRGHFVIAENDNGDRKLMHMNLFS